jgi:preprotein translocase subunit SecD
LWCLAVKSTSKRAKWLHACTLAAHVVVVLMSWWYQSLSPLFSLVALTVSLMHGTVVSFSLADLFLN